MHPISASILAAVVVGEPIGLNLAVGVVAVLAGIWIAAGDAEQRRKAGIMSERIGVLIAVLSSTHSAGWPARSRASSVGTIDPVTLAAFRFGIGVAACCCRSR